MTTSLVEYYNNHQEDIEYMDKKIRRGKDIRVHLWRANRLITALYVLSEIIRKIAKIKPKSFTRVELAT